MMAFETIKKTVASIILLGLSEHCNALEVTADVKECVKIFHPTVLGDLYEKYPKLEKILSDQYRVRFGGQPDASIYGKMRSLIATQYPIEGKRLEFDFVGNLMSINGHLRADENVFHVDVPSIGVKGGAFFVGRGGTRWGKGVPEDKFAFIKMAIAIFEGFELRVISGVPQPPKFEFQASRVVNYSLLEMLRSFEFTQIEGTRSFFVSFSPSSYSP